MNRQSIEFTETQTTAVPDLPEFLFKQFGHPPLTDNQILALLIGRNPILNEPEIEFKAITSVINAIKPDVQYGDSRGADDETDCADRGDIGGNGG